MGKPPALAALDIEHPDFLLAGRVLGARLTVKASRRPSGENRKSVIERNAMACSTASAAALAALSGFVAVGWAKTLGTPANRTNREQKRIRTVLISQHD